MHTDLPHAHRPTPCTPTYPPRLRQDPSCPPPPPRAHSGTKDRTTRGGVLFIGGGRAADRAAWRHRRGGQNGCRRRAAAGCGGWVACGGWRCRCPRCGCGAPWCAAVRGCADSSGTASVVGAAHATSVCVPICPALLAGLNWARRVLAGLNRAQPAGQAPIGSVRGEGAPIRGCLYCSDWWQGAQGPWAARRPEKLRGPAGPRAVTVAARAGRRSTGHRWVRPSLPAVRLLWPMAAVLGCADSSAGASGSLRARTTSRRSRFVQPAWAGPDLASQHAPCQIGTPTSRVPQRLPASGAGDRRTADSSHGHYPYHRSDEPPSSARTSTPPPPRRGGRAPRAGHPALVRLCRYTGIYLAPRSHSAARSASTVLSFRTANDDGNTDTLPDGRPNPVISRDNKPFSVLYTIFVCDGLKYHS